MSLTQSFVGSVRGLYLLDWTTIQLKPSSYPENQWGAALADTGRRTIYPVSISQSQRQAFPTIYYSSLMRDYFNSLGDSAHPNSSDPRARAITKFQELLLVSFREF